MTRSKNYSMILAAFIYPLLVCGAGAAFDHDAFIRQTIKQHIVPGFVVLDDSAGVLEDAVRAYCAAPAGDQRQAVDAAFRNTVLAWAGVEHLRFGPLLRRDRDQRLAFWPDPKGIGVRQLGKIMAARDASVLDQQNLEIKSVALQGLTSLEYLLYGDGHQELYRPGDGRTFRCGFANAVAANIKVMTAELRTEWLSDTGFVQDMLTAGSDTSVYLEPDEVTQQLVRALFEGIEVVRDLKIADPLGFRVGRKRPEKAAFAKSGLAIAMIAKDIAVLEMFMTDSGLMQHIADESEETAAQLRDHLASARRITESITVGIVETVNDEDLSLNFAQTGFHLKTVRNIAVQALTEMVGLTLGFNALDGD